MYQAYPGGSEPPGPSQQTTAPLSVLRAVQIMYAGAVVSLIGIVIDLTTVGSLKSAIEQSCKAGKSWARIVSTVLFAVDTISVLIGVGGAAPGGHATRFYGIVVWLVGLAAIILLWRRSSSNYFNSAPRY